VAIQFKNNKPKLFRNFTKTIIKLSKLTVGSAKISKMFHAVRELLLADKTKTK